MSSTPFETRHRSDPRGHEHGPPAYVGQSKQMYDRADAHMEDGGRGTAGGRCKAGRLHEIMRGFRVPKFQILDEAPTLVTSLIAETVWARRFFWLGYKLSNQWAEHCSTDPPKGLQDVPTKRLWALTAAEAIEDEVGLVLECTACAVSQPIDLGSLESSVKLQSLRTLKHVCPGCAAPLLHLRRPSPSTWKWSSYSPRPMPRSWSG